MSFVSTIRRGMSAAVAGAVILGATAVPSTAFAADNYEVISVARKHPYLYPEQMKIWYKSVRYTYNQDDPIELTAELSVDGTSVVITVTTAAAGGLVVNAPCTKTSSTTAVCPTSYTENGANKVIAHVQVEATSGDDDITVDVPGLSTNVSAGAGDDVVEVVACSTSSISGGAGDDLLIGGTGTDYITADGGTDIIHVESSPDAVDYVWCGNSSVESPVDTVYADTVDVLQNTNCLNVIIP